MEYCKKGDLKAFLNKKKNPINEKEIITIFKQICIGLKDIHSKDVIHQDLKPSNIFLTEKNHIKIGDFGISLQLKKNKKEITNNGKEKGTYNYMAPELFEIGSHYNNKIDIWSLGCLLYELCQNEYYFDGNTVAVVNQIKQFSQNKKEIDKKYDEKLQKLIDSMIVEPEKRPDISAILLELKLFETINEILINIKIEKNDRENDIYFFGNNTEKKEKNYFDNFNEIKEDNNINLYINNEKNNIKIKNKFEKEGDFKILFRLNKKLNNCRDMFSDCKNITSIDLSLFDSSDVTDMSKMFCQCINIEKLDLSFLNTSNLLKMNGMFYNCEKLKEIDLSTLDNPKVTDMNGMFRLCKKLECINLKNFKTENVKDMTDMFDDCQSLKRVYLDFKTLETKELKKLNDMFNNCTSLME